MPPGPLESGENDTEKRVKGSPTASAVCGKPPRSGAEKRRREKICTGKQRCHEFEERR